MVACEHFDDVQAEATAHQAGKDADLGAPEDLARQLGYALAPGAQDLVVNRAYKLFPEGDGKPQIHEPSAEQRAFARATRGVHW